MSSPALLLPRDTTDAEIGGRVCLALVNTVYWRRSEAPVEALSSYDALVSAFGGVLDEATSTGLRAAATAHPRRAGRALDTAMGLREALHGVFAAVAAGTPQPGHDRRVLDERLRDALAHLVLDGTQATLAPTDDLDLPAWHAALSAAALLTSGPLDRVKACPGPTCGWLFVDSTRNGSRRWCDPAQCGNRERVRAHYRRTHGQE